MKKTKDKEEQSPTQEKSPYMSKAIYGNYAKGMKEKNVKRHKQGLEAIPIRTYEEWSN